MNTFCHSTIAHASDGSCRNYSVSNNPRQAVAGAVLPSHLTNGMTGHLRFTRQTRSSQKAGSSSTTKNTKISDSPEKPSHNPAPKQASSFIRTASPVMK